MLRLDGRLPARMPSTVHSHPRDTHLTSHAQPTTNVIVFLILSPTIIILYILGRLIRALSSRESRASISMACQEDRSAALLGLRHLIEGTAGRIAFYKLEGASG